MKSGFVYVAVLQYTPQQIETYTRKLQAKRNSPESIKCRIAGLLDMGKG